MTICFARPVHPGEFLREEYLVPLGMSAGSLARELHVPRTRIERIVKEEIGVTPDTALRLAKFFDTTPQFWMNFQTAWELAAEAQAKQAEIDGIRVSARDMAVDVAIFDSFHERLARGEEERIPSKIVDRLLVGENPVKVWRSHRGLTARELADKTGLSASYISEIERGRKDGSISAMKKIAGVLGLDLDEVV